MSEAPPTWLAWLVAVQAILLVSLVAALVVGAVIRQQRHRRGQRLAAQLQPRLRAFVLDGRDTGGAVAGLAALPWGVQVDQLSALAAVLTGSSRARLRALAEHAGVLARTDRWLGSLRWHRRLRALRVLTILGAGQGQVAPLLHDPDAEVRAQAAVWVGEFGSPDEVASMVTSLDADPLLPPRVLVDALSRAGSRAADPLLLLLERGDLVDPVPALTVAATLADPRFVALAHRWSGHDDARARAAAVPLLAALGGDEAAGRLRVLLADPAPAVRAAATRALVLAGPTVAPALAARLTDPAWEVRRAAGLALRELGAVGRLYLQRARRSPDRFAADMAEQVLGLPAEVLR